MAGILTPEERGTHSRQRPLAGKGDWIIVLALLAAALSGWVLWRGVDGGTANKAEITYPKGVLQVSLDVDRSFGIEEGPDVRFQIQDGAIAFVDSDCPDKICIHTGWLSRPGQTAVCLPNGVVLQVVGEAGDGPDFVVR